jgi:putative thioredoxin
MAIDVTDATFETDVMERSMTTPVVVDLWAPWCGPCKTLGPILEKVIDATGGKVVLAKVNVDENPAISQAFRVQSIPAVYAIDKGAVVNGFQGAYPEQAVQQFVDTLLPTAVDEEIAELVRAGDEASLRRALELSPGDESAVVALANVLTESGRGEEALQVLARVPESDDVRKAAAAARMSLRPADDYDHQLNVLIDKVKGDDDARQQFVDILELMGPDDPRTAQWRKKLTARLF